LVVPWFFSAFGRRGLRPRISFLYPMREVERTITSLGLKPEKKGKSLKKKKKEDERKRERV